jgi:hypothetical protein
MAPQHLYVGVIVAHLSYGLVKLAVLQFYKRIFSTPRFRMTANITMVFVATFMLTATLVSTTLRLGIVMESLHIVIFTRPAGPDFLRLAYI